MDKNSTTMSSKEFDRIKNHLMRNQHVWLITGVAGFIGSHLMQALLKLDQNVVGIDNFSTGFKRNIDEVLQNVPLGVKNNFNFYKGDICSLDDCKKAMRGVDYVLHQAALGSVPLSIEKPLATHSANMNGFINILLAAKNSKVKRFVYASSSSVYGDSLILPLDETHVGKPSSPYAASKLANEIYAQSFSQCFGLETIGLRYFNVFGPRQDANGAYAAVIPIWVKALLNKETIFINGDGKTTRDFCYIENVVQANLLAATVADHDALNTVYNIAVGERTSLDELCAMLKSIFKIPFGARVEYRKFRVGDIKHSFADISKAKNLLKYEPTHKLNNGLQEALSWYRSFLVSFLV